MPPRRKSHPTLTMSRIYVKGKRYYLFAREPVEHPETGKIARWHPLGPVADGELLARHKAASILKGKQHIGGRGSMPSHVESYRLDVLKRRETKRPTEAPRRKIFEAGNDNITSVCRVIGSAFEDFDVEQPIGVDVARFVDQWAGQRAAQVYLSRLTDFFRWAIRKGLRTDNPCADIRVEKPENRTRYLTDSEWHAVRDALLIGKDDRKTSSGPMIQCYVDLCYLLYQRTTEIRLLKWPQVDLEAGTIAFRPTKTERSSGVAVLVPITADVRSVLERAKTLGKIKGIYVIHTAKGQPYTANGIGSAWRRACERAGVEDATLKDIRAKAATDAKKRGYSRKEISVGLAHTGEGMTEHYLRGRGAEMSNVELSLPSDPRMAANR